MWSEQRHQKNVTCRKNPTLVSRLLAVASIAYVWGKREFGQNHYAKPETFPQIAFKLPSRSIKNSSLSRFKRFLTLMDKPLLRVLFFSQNKQRRLTSYPAISQTFGGGLCLQVFIQNSGGFSFVTSVRELRPPVLPSRPALPVPVLLKRVQLIVLAPF
jgi:hypothetical protein